MWKKRYLSVFSAEGYRLRFQIKRRKFANSLKNNFTRWVEFADYEQTYVDISDFVLTEQCLNACDKSMLLLLKENAFQTSDQMIKYTELYKEAHVNNGRKDREGHGLMRGTNGTLRQV